VCLWRSPAQLSRKVAPAAQREERLEPLEARRELQQARPEAQPAVLVMRPAALATRPATPLGAWDPQPVGRSVP
jgi:hypothetical protein